MAAVGLLHQPWRDLSFHTHCFCRVAVGPEGGGEWGVSPSSLPKESQFPVPSLLALLSEAWLHPSLQGDCTPALQVPLQLSRPGVCIVGTGWLVLGVPCTRLIYSTS